MLLTIVHKKSTLIKVLFVLLRMWILSPNFFNTGLFTGKTSKVEDS